MSHPRKIAAAVALTLAAALPAHAARTTAGPFLDLKAEVSPQEQVIGGSFSTFTHVLALTTGYPNYVPTVPFTLCAQAGGACHLVGVSDYAVWHGAGPYTPARVAGVSYLSSDDLDPVGVLRFTTVYGVDLAPPSSAQLAVTGFDATAPQLVFDSEQVTGPDGRVYTAGSRQFVTLADLGGVLGAGFDLSPFRGDPASAVYVFSTMLPASALAAVPEPQAWALFVLGAAVLRRCLSRRPAVQAVG